jgi:RNA polymerase sigma-70 factor, ECF subfamily
VGADTADAELVARLRAGDEQAFAALVGRYHGPLLRLAATFVPNRAVAEEVVQETWLAVLRGIDRFEGRSSFKTWLFRILVNRARTTGSKERRSVPVDLASELGSGPTVAAARFGVDGHWTAPPASWSDDVDRRLDAEAPARALRAGLASLPPLQGRVVHLRDVVGLSSAEVCTLLEISEGNQRVLLHRGRSRLRSRLEDEMGRV